jgi:quercetin dioxygenase-like cupin family protein
MNSKLQFFNFILLLELFALTESANAEVASAKFSHQILLKKRVAFPSKEIDTHVLRVQFPKGFKTPLHTHEGPGPRYVVKGKLKVEDRSESKIYEAGEIFWETGAEMTVENIGPTEAELIIFEMVASQ